MIDIYSWATPNGHKVHIMLEECQLEYKAHGINIGQGEQFLPEFLKISPNNKVPAMVDTDGPHGQTISLFESGAILFYLAEKTGLFLGNHAAERYSIMQWLMFQMGGFGPMLGQTHHFRLYATEKIPYAINRYTNEARRLYQVLDKQLAENQYVAGNEYSIADIAIFPWTRSANNQNINLSDFKHINRWYQKVAARPAVEKGCRVLLDQRVPLNDDQARKHLFGDEQYRQR